MRLDFRRMGFMKINDFGLGPEGTFHKSPARSAGTESKRRLKESGRPAHHGRGR